MSCRDGARNGRWLAIGPLVALLVTVGLANPEEASAQEPHVQAFGYDGCELLKMTEFFELGPGEVFTFVVDMSQCYPRDVGRVGYWGYTKRGWRARELLVRDGIDLKMHDMEDGLELEYASMDGFETLGAYEQSSVVLSGAGYVLLSAENTTRKPKMVKLHFQSGF
jgi:hypothetical protein